MSSDPFAPSFLSADNPLMPRLYQAAIGPMQTAYYQQQFERFDALGKPVASWNWAAGLCTLGWMALRGLWRPAAIYAAVVALIVSLWWIVGLHHMLPQPLAWALALLLVLAAVAVPGLGGNALYHHDVRARTMQALTQSRTLTEAMTQLQTQAPTPTQLQWATTGHALAALLAAGVVWAMASATSSPPTAPAAKAAAHSTVRTQEDTARALAALVPARKPDSSTPSATTPEGTSSSAAPASPSVDANASPAAPATSTVAAITPPPPAATPATSTATAVATTASASPPSAPLPTAPVAAPPSAAETDSQPAASSKPTSSSKTASAPQRDKPSKVEKTAKTEAKPQAQRTGLQAGKYYLNSGIYAQPDNARRAVRQLRSAELPVFTQQLESRKGEVTRVRIGPFDNRSQAEAAARKAQALKLEAQVFRYSAD